MENFKVIENSKGFLLLFRRRGVYETEIVDHGVCKEIKLDGSLVGLQKPDKTYSYYYYKEKEEEVVKVAEKVDGLLARKSKEKVLFIFWRDVEYFYKYLGDDQETSLGSYEYKGMFLSGKDGDITARFFKECDLIERKYIKQRPGWLNANEVNIGMYCLRFDGYYDLFSISDACVLENKSIYERSEQLIRWGTEKHGDYCRIFWYDSEVKGYKLLFEGNNRCRFRNAILDIMLDDGKENIRRAFFSLIEDGKIKLTAESGNLREMSKGEDFIRIGDQIWDACDGDKYLLKTVARPFCSDVYSDNPQTTELNSVPEKKGFLKLLFGK